jgi:hypothetical protein
MGVNDELTPGEHADLRARLVSGAARIKPVGKHRGAWVSGAVAVALVAAIAGGVGIGATWSAPPPVTGPVTPSPTPTLSPTLADPSPTPTPTPVRDPALVGDCGSMLTTAEVSSSAGTAMESRPSTGSGFSFVDAAPTVGGLSCAWSSEEPYAFLSLSFYPLAVVPAELQGVVDVVPPCVGGGDCVYASVFGDVWVVASGTSAEQITAAVNVAGPRAAASFGTAERRSPGWSIPDCDSILGLATQHLGRTDFSGWSSDARPHGWAWDVLVANGAASWCGTHGGGNADYLDELEVAAFPGLGDINRSGLQERGAETVQVAGASEAWLLRADAPNSSAVYAVSNGNVLIVSGRFISDEALIDLAGELIAELG